MFDTQANSRQFCPSRVQRSMENIVHTENTSFSFAGVADQGQRETNRATNSRQNGGTAT
ncbi:hypothetical protein AGR8A_Cc40598 [Agrobacterium fabrum str. J-07]|nr:hypothetical protein AGR8A_Cc40598 [Agrobacterium fabrum str. J-07]